MYNTAQMMSPDEQKSKEGIILTEEDIEIVFGNVLELNNAIFRENLILGNVIQETDFNEVINAHRNSNIEINQPLRLTDLQNYRITINSKLKRMHWQQKAYYTESMLDFQERQKIQILIESGDFEEANRLFLENG